MKKLVYSFITIVALVILLSLFVILQINYTESIEEARASCFPNSFKPVIRPKLPQVIAGCESNSNKNLRIINGQISEKHKFPWAVLISDETRSFMCGGSVLSESWILTAAHCCTKANSNLYIIAGTNDITDTLESQRRRVARKVIHPQWDKKCGRNDLALLKLDFPLLLGESVSKICLPDRDYDLSRVPLVAIGWGVTEHGVSSRFLREAVVYERPNCTNMSSPELQICVEDISGGEARQARGDSGSSLVTYVDKVPVIVGVTAYGPPPVISIRVAKYTSWINDTIK